MINQVIQRFKNNSSGKASASLILGIISGVLVITPIIMSKFGFPFPPIMGLGSLIMFIVFIIVPLLTIIGLILGIQGLKTTKKKIAIVGIVLNSIGLLVPLYYFIFS